MGEEFGKESIVAFLGPKASYTHQATKKAFSQKSYHLVPLIAIEDVFAAVQAGTASYGVVPFENSSNGSVVFTLDLFADAAHRYSDIVVHGEIYIPVQHCLLGHIVEGSPSLLQRELVSRQLKDEAESPTISGQITPTQEVPQPIKARAKPEHNIKHIKKIYSHPQAWGQCKAFIATYLKKAEKQDVSSTSKAAELVAADPSGATAAISSKIAAELNGLDVLAEGIEDSAGNSTRFFILRRWQDGEDLDHGGAGAAFPDEMERYKSLVSFTVDHAEPGALADSLAVFKKHHLNLTSINTRPSGASAWHYIFFIEFIGRKRPGGEGGAVNVALEELTKLVETYRWLGSWEKATQD